MGKIRRRSPKRLGEILIEEGLLTRDQFEEALAQQKKEEENKLLGEILVDMGYISYRDLAKALVLQFAIPYMAATSYNIDFELMSKIPIEVMEHHRFVVLDSFGDTVVIAAAGQLTDDLFQLFETNLGMKLSVFASTLEEVNTVLQRYKEWKKRGAAKTAAEPEPSKPKPSKPKPSKPKPKPERPEPAERAPQEAAPEADWSKLMERKEDAEVLKELEKSFEEHEFRAAETDKEEEEEEDNTE